MGKIVDLAVSSESADCLVKSCACGPVVLCVIHFAYLVLEFLFRLMYGLLMLWDLSELHKWLDFEIFHMLTGRLWTCSTSTDFTDSRRKI